MFSSDKWFGASPSFYNGVATQSLRFDRSSSSYLIKENTSVTSTQKWTLSVWIKRCSLGTEQGILGSSATAEYIRFQSDDTLRYRLYTSSSQRISMITSTKFRDTSNFFHLVCAVDLSNTTDNDKAIIYVNGTRQPLGTNITTSTDTYNSKMLQNGGHYWNLGRYSGYFDGYMADVHLIDGQQLDPTYFAQTKSGVWIPKEYTGTYGNSGARLEFKGTGTSTSSGTVSTPTNIGDDSSGNNNHFHANNVSAHDSNMPDCPENNFATFNVLTGHTATTMSEGNLRGKGANSSNILESQSSTIGVTSGKWYAEFRADDLVNDTQNNGTQIGVTTVPYIRGSGNQNGYVVGNTRVNLDQSGGAYLGVDQNISTTIGSYADGDIIGVALNVDDSEVSFYKNGSAITNATNASINPQNDLHFFEIQLRKYDGDTSQITANFGQDSTFSGAVSGGGNTDSRGRGDFKYSVPSGGYLALCTANLPDLAISPNQQTQADDHFDTIIYDGSSSNKTVTTNFQADWLWFKERTTTGIQPQMFDSSRLHSSSSAKFGRKLEPNSTGAEGDSTAVQSQSGNDITLLGGVSTTNDASSRTYTMWHWKANGGNTTSFSEVGNNPGGTHQANTTGGFSIVTYTGTGSSGTVSHGLGAVPGMYLVKNRDVSTHNWLMWHQDLATNGFIALNLTQQAYYDSARFTSNNPTSSVFYVGTDASTNADGENFVAYVFAEVEGYSRFGSYESNNDADGTFVYTGFRPAFLITKNIDRNSMSWIMYDNKRDTSNEMNNNFNIGTSSEPYHSTGSSIDFLSNGFKFRDGSSSWNNYSTETYIYMAFAEQPFKFSNAR